MTDSGVAINLSRDQALVLFEWLARFNSRGDNSFEDPAEQRVLWDIEAVLESSLSEPLEPNYERLLARARDNVRDSEK